MVEFSRLELDWVEIDVNVGELVVTAVPFIVLVFADTARVPEVPD